MDSKIQRSAESFIMNLTGADAAEVQECVDEIRLNQEFHNRIEEKQSTFGGRGRWSWDWGVGTTLGVVLYAVCRRQNPDIVVETGVASGVSSSYILCALEKNGHGELYSIDMPWWQQDQSGWMIPD